MPEGPEIRLAADKVARILVGNEIVAADFGLPALRPFARDVIGSTVTAVDTRGKAMLTRFDNGLTLYSHNQLYGRWYTKKRPGVPRTNRQQRVALHTRTHSALLYSASDIEFLDQETESRHPFLTRVGPDILDAALTADHVADRLRSTAFCNRALGGLYLDQSFLAGNGNYLRSEILWAARVHPATRPAALDSNAVARLSRQTLVIAKRSYKTRGITAPVGAARERMAEGMSFGQARFQVYGRDGSPCYRCGAPIERLDSGGRGVFVCGACQSA